MFLVDALPSQRTHPLPVEETVAISGPYFDSIDSTFTTTFPRYSKAEHFCLGALYGVDLVSLTDRIAWEHEKL